MKFFRPEIVFGGGDDFRALQTPEGVRLFDAYHRQTERLPRALKELAHLPGVDDTWIVSGEWDGALARLSLTLRGGDLQIGYFDLELIYRGATLDPETLATLKRLATSESEGAFSDVAFHELDRLPDGRVEHRWLFHGEAKSVNLVAEHLAWRKVPVGRRGNPAPGERLRVRFSPPATAPMRSGVGSYTWPWAVDSGRLDAMGVIERAARAGVAVVQLCDNLPLKAENPEGVRAACERSGLRLEVGVADLRTVEAWLPWCRRSGARLLRIVVDASGYPPEPGEIAGELARLIELAPETLVFAVENHDRLPAKTLREIVDSIGHPRVGVCLDTANSLGAAEDLNTVLEHLTERALCLHLKDVEIARWPHKMGFTIVGAEPGTGRIDLDDAYARVAANGVCESVVVEQWPKQEDTLDETIAREAAWADAGIQRLLSARSAH